MSGKYIPGHGPIGAKLLILGEAPSYEEVEAGRPFVGPSGRELDKLLKDSDINRNSCWLTNVCKYMVTPAPRGSKIPFHVRASNDGINLNTQLSELQNEINAIQPNCILALGGTALWALTGKNKITNYRGSIMLGMGRKMVPTYHPAHLLHAASGGEFKGYWNRFLIIHDMKRAAHQATFPELVLPTRVLQIAKNSYQFWDFLNRYKGYTKPAVDIEAGGHCVPICMGISFAPHEGITLPLWNSDGISTIPDSDLVQIWIMLAEFLATHDIVGQNFKYDQDKIRRLGFIIRSLASDTMLKSFALHPELPKRLAHNQSVYTEEPFYKDEGMYEGSITDLLLGCARDACVTKEIDLAMDKDIDAYGMRSYYENFILPQHNFYLDMENEGFCVNKEKRDELIHKYVSWNERITYDLYKLVGAEVNVNSPKQVSILLFDNLRLPRRKGTGEEELTALLAVTKNAEHRRIMELILEGRRVRKTISTYLMANPDFDGKMRTTFYPCLETGRSKTGQQDPPIRPKFSAKTGELGTKGGPDWKCLGTAFQTLTKHGDIGQDVRSMYVPEPGFVFVNADSSQAEARVIFLLADDEEALILVDTNDYHAITASWFFGGTENDYSKRVLGYEHPVRFIGKTLRHAGHLGASKKIAAQTVNTDARKYKINTSITEAFAEVCLRTFHTKQPKIKENYHLGVQKCLENNKRVLISPVPFGVDSPTGGKRMFFERWGDELFRQAYAYLPQRTVTDNTKNAGMRLKKKIKELRIIMESHDALVFMIPENRVDDWTPHIKEEMERPIRFDTCSIPRRELSIPCELEIGYNYQEFKKFKFKSEYPLLHEAI